MFTLYGQDIRRNLNIYPDMTGYPIWFININLKERATDHVYVLVQTVKISGSLNIYPNMAGYQVNSSIQKKTAKKSFFK